MEASLLLLLGFLVLFLAGFPVVAAVLLPSLAYVVWNELPLAMVAQRTVYALDSFPLVAVPIFFRNRIARAVRAVRGAPDASSTVTVEREDTTPGA